MSGVALNGHIRQCTERLFVRRVRQAAEGLFGLVCLCLGSLLAVLDGAGAMEDGQDLVQVRHAVAMGNGIL